MAAQLFRLALAIVLTLVTGAARALPIVNVPSTTDVCCFGDGILTSLSRSSLGDASQKTYPFPYRCW